jgi:hypothetical protein
VAYPVVFRRQLNPYLLDPIERHGSESRHEPEERVELLREGVLGSAGSSGAHINRLNLGPFQAMKQQLPRQVSKTDGV